MKPDLKDYKNQKIKEYIRSSTPQDGFGDLHDFLLSLINLFIYKEDGVKLVDLIQRDWGIFTNRVCGEKVLNDLIIESSEDVSDKNVKTANSTVTYSPQITASVDLWEKLKKDIKEVHRFTTDISSLQSDRWIDLLDNDIPVQPDKIYYRARIHYKKTDEFGIKDMGAREKGDCPAGRANPEGIPYLYLCEEPETTLYETRATFHDDVSIGEFKLKEDLNLSIADLSKLDINDRNLEILDMDIVSLAKRILLIEAISQDMSKPMRRQDSLVEYVPTQFICEYLQKTRNVGGIRFSSSVYPKGLNVVIFNPEVMECIRVSKHHVTSLKISESII